MFWKWVAAGLVALWLLVGCERRPAAGPSTGGDGDGNSSAAAASPATRPATGPATTAPAEVVLTIEGAVEVFPPARLRLDEQDDRVVALLFSDDPPAALNEDYDGNSFYLQLPLDVASAAEIGAATYQFKADTSEKSDGPHGIFLQGSKWHLQPEDVRIVFRVPGDAGAAAPRDGAPADGDAPTTPAEKATTLPASPVTVVIAGTFRMFDTDNPRLPGAIVPVAGELQATVRARKGGDD